MKKWLLSAVAALGLLATGAQAATYNAGVTATSFRDPGAPGLQLRTWKLGNSGSLSFTGTSLGFDLTNVGDTFTADIYRLVAFDIGLDADDLVPKAATATFDFGSFGTITLLGTTVGVSGATSYAIASFASGTISLGGGLSIVVSIADAIFATDGTNYVSGKAGAAPVTATFTLAAVPLPATLPLGLLALGGLAAVARRRKRVSA